MVLNNSAVKATPSTTLGLFVHQATRKIAGQLVRGIYYRLDPPACHNSFANVMYSFNQEQTGLVAPFTLP
jgi:hypothetical protein